MWQLDRIAVVGVHLNLACRLGECRFVVVGPLDGIKGGQKIAVPNYNGISPSAIGPLIWLQLKAAQEKSFLRIFTR